MSKILTNEKGRYTLFEEKEIKNFDESVEEDYSELESIDEDETTSTEDLDESIKKVKVVRNGKKITVKKSTKDGYKIKDGKEVKMSSSEKKNRKKAQKKASKKRKTKSASSARKRAKSMKKK